MNKHERAAASAYLQLAGGDSGSNEMSGVGRRGRGRLPVTAREIRALKRTVAAERRTVKAGLKAAKAKGGKK